MNTSSFERIAFLLLRLVAGLLFFQAGAAKLFGWFGGMPSDQPPLEMFSQIWIGAVIEVVGGLLVMIGLFVRPAAFVMSGQMAVAYWQFHYGWGSGKGWTWPAQNHGGEAVLMCFIFLYICAHGAGMLSIDEGRELKKAKKPAR